MLCKCVWVERLGDRERSCWKASSLVVYNNGKCQPVSFLPQLLWEIAAFMGLKYINTFHNVDWSSFPLPPSFPTSAPMLCFFVLHLPSSSSSSDINHLSHVFFSSFLLSANSSLPNLKSIWYGVWPLASQLPLEQLWHTQPLLCLI